MYLGCPQCGNSSAASVKTSGTTAIVRWQCEKCTSASTWSSTKYIENTTQGKYEGNIDYVSALSLSAIPHDVSISIHITNCKTL